MSTNSKSILVEEPVLLPKHATLSIPRFKSSQFIRPGDQVSHLFPSGHDHMSVMLKNDSVNRPLWISDDGHIYLEAFSALSGPAQDFLTAIADPICRPHYIHEFQITPYSLYAAASVGLDTDDILNVLERLSKVSIPAGLASFIRSATQSFGKVKLVLHHNRYWIETTFPDVLQALVKDSLIQSTRRSTTVDTALQSRAEGASHPNPVQHILSILDNEDDELADNGSLSCSISQKQVFSFEIDPSKVEHVKRRCIELDYPMLEEYDFRNDSRLPPLNIHLRTTAQLRPYQERSLAKVFGGGRARSGLIVLPCGAGKTLVGITAAATIKKATLVLCTSAVAVEQWRAQFRVFSAIPDDRLARFTADAKETWSSGTAGVLLTTYTMVAHSGKRSSAAQVLMNLLTHTEWGLLLMDEVHVVPAAVFRRVLTTVAAHTKIGLTATLVREDDRISDLHFLIGPKLYEASWLDLARQGHIARVRCVEVRCPLPPSWAREYLQEHAARRRRLLTAMNPSKLQACAFLVKYHEARGDKIIVFSDSVYALKAYALLLKRPFLYGPTSQTERLRLLHQFQANPQLRTLFLSKVGDTSIDLPEATVLIQISSHYGSRRQEAQRLGRILRAKRRSEDGFHASFYTLVTSDTDEAFYASKRQQFLVDQGYAFSVLPELPPSATSIMPDIPCVSQKDQLELLRSVLVATEAELADEDIDVSDQVPELDGLTGSASSRSSLGLTGLSGADDLAYIEYNRPARASPVVAGFSAPNIAKPRHPLFKARYK